MAQARQGSVAAWQHLYRRVVGIAWREAYAIVAAQCAAEEVVAEAMSAVVRGLGTLDLEDCRLSGWVRTIARNKAIDHVRAQKRRRGLVNGLQSRGAAEVPPTPDQQLATAEKRRQIRTVLDALTEDQRTVLQWKYVDELPVRDIATRLQLSEKAAEALLFRARREFRRRYDAAEQQDDHPILPMFPATSSGATPHE